MRGGRAQRARNFEALGGDIFDVLVVGGGINGAVAAACVAGRGGKVALIDRGDFASFTSQQSSNLAWGGIKYMETWEFGLVRKLCVSRNHLIRSYPSSVREIRFFAVHRRGFRHALWKLVLGTFLYWLIGSFFTKRPRRLSREAIAREEPAVGLDQVDGGFEYSDAYLIDNDARFVWMFVRRAIDAGATAVNYAESLGSTRDASGVWETRVRNVCTGEETTVRSRVLVNAAGPFVDTMNVTSNVRTEHRHVFSKGIHLVVDRVTPHRRVLTFFADDGRLFFVIPMGAKTCIGTTDTRVDGPLTHVTPDDRKFVLDNINKRLALARPLVEADIIAERCGVRPLAVRGEGQRTSDWTQLSRKHVVEVDAVRRHVSVFGGKLTDCINVGEEIARVVSRLGVELPDAGARWYGEPDEATKQAFFAHAARMELDARMDPNASEPLSVRLWRRYGADADALLDAIESDPSLADPIVPGAECIQAEARYAAEREMVVTLEDFLRRRTMVALVTRRDALARADGVRRACELLFGVGAEAEAAHARYFREAPGDEERKPGGSTGGDAAPAGPAKGAPPSSPPASRGRGEPARAS
jgi:glycerol-3-phosphate dehydrogenase